jgi:hypothetical protein
LAAPLTSQSVTMIHPLNSRESAFQTFAESTTAPRH